jgi:hypothetical protein
MRKRRFGFGGLSRADAEFMAAALVGYDQQRLEILEKMAELRRQLGGRRVDAAVGSLDGTRPVRKKRAMSAAGRRRIAAAQRKRWAKFHKTQEPVATKPAKRKMSAAARKRIRASTKKTVGGA